MSAEQMQDAMEESVMQSEFRVMEDDIVEVSTSFTIGDAVEAAVEEVRSFAESQLPCATVEVADSTLTIDFGELGDLCVYNGHSYAGVVALTYTLDGDELVVEHEYEALTNGVARLDGEATVTWSEQSLHVLTDLHFTRGSRELEVQGDRVMTYIEPDLGLAGGIEINGQRDWQGAAGNWSLDIEGIEVRLQDPLPQDGSYTLVTPEAQEVVLEFSRVDEDTIAVLFQGPQHSRVFHVTATGHVSDQGEVDA